MNTTPSGDASGERVDAGLRAAFDASDPFAFPPPSVLEALSRGASTSLPRVLLRSPTEAEPESVVRPSSEELPSGPTGRYQLHGEIARGGMGVVVRGRDVDLGRDLALKVLLGRHQKRPEMIERFVEEAQIGGQLQHPGIVPVYELGHFPGGRPYFTMKLVKGKTLSALLAARKDPGEDRARFLGIFEQVAQTLAYAHARGVIHRDLKPSNVMVGSFGEVQVMDWGLAKVLRDGGVADERKAGAERAAVSSDDFPARRLRRLPDASSIRTARSEGSSGGSSGGYETEAGSVLGTPAYMAPEQARGEVETVDERADVFGLGAILCEVLTGDPPFTGKPAEAQRKARQGDLREAREQLERCGADPELVEIARRCLDPVPQDRPANAGEVAAAISGHLESVERRLRKAELELAEEQARAEEAQARMREEERGRKEAQARALAERRARRLTLALATLVLLVVTGGGAAGIWLKAAQDQKRAQVVRQVHLALERAEGLRERAKAAPPGDLGPWQAARAEADRAREIAESGESAGREILTRVNDLIREIGEEERNQKFLADIETAWLAQMDFVIERNRWSREQAVPILRKALEAYGLPAGRGDASEAAAKVRSLPPPVRDALIAALDDWIYIAGNRDYGVDEPHLEWLRAVVAGADQDPWRGALRVAMAESDREKRKRAIEDLAEDPDLARQPLPDLMLLARQLEGKAPDKEVEVLTRVYEAHPDDFSVLFRLGMALNFHLKPPRPEEAVRYLTAAVTVRPQSAKAQLNLGNALRDQGKSDEAIAAFQRAIQLQPKYSAGYNNLGGAMERLGKRDEAIGYYRKAIELDRHSAMAYTNLASVLGKLGKTEEAMALLKKALEVEPKYADAHNSLGAAMAEQGKIDEAIAHYRKAIEFSPDNYFAYNNLANAMGDKGELEEAISLYQKAIEIKPNYAEAHFNLGMLLSKHDRIEEAVAAFKKAIGLKPDFAKAYRALGAALTNHDRPEEALPLYQKALELEPDFADAYYDLGLTQKKRGRLEEAITAFNKAIDLKPQDAEAHLQLGDALAKQGNIEEANDAYRKAIDLKPDNAEAYNNLGNALTGQGKLEEAVACLRKAIELKPDHAGIYNNLGITLTMGGKLEEAIACYRKAIDLDPGYAEAYVSLGNAADAQGKPEEAVSHFKKAIELKPDHAGAHVNLGNAMLRQGKVEEAIATYQKTIEIKPNYADPYNGLGVALERQGKIDEAITALKKAVELKPDYAQAYANLGLELSKRDRFEEAIAAFQKAVELEPDAETFFRLGYVLSKQGRLEEAIAANKKSIELEPENANSYVSLGCALSEAGKVGESIPQFRKALELDQKNAQAYQNLGVALRKLGKFEEAIPQFQKAIELKQDYSEAHNDLGNALRKLNKIDEAIAVLRKAVKLMPKDAVLACNLGHALKQKGQFAEALKWLERSHELEPKDLLYAEWVEEARRLVAAEAKLPALLQGGPSPGEASECFDLAWVAYQQQLFLASARFFAEGLSKSPAGDPESAEHRYNGACAAALAASGRGADREKLDEAGRARWRRQAREWLRAELKLSRAEFATAKPETQDGIRQLLAQMLSDSDFAGVRGEKALAKLPTAEAKEWKQLWKDVAGLLERARSQ